MQGLWRGWRDGALPPRKVTELEEESSFKVLRTEIEGFFGYVAARNDARVRQKFCGKSCSTTTGFLRISDSPTLHVPDCYCGAPYKSLFFSVGVSEKSI